MPAKKKTATAKKPVKLEALAKVNRRLSSRPDPADFSHVLKTSHQNATFFPQVAYFHFATMIAEVKPLFILKDIEPIPGNVFSLMVKLELLANPRDVEYGDYSDGGKTLGEFVVPTLFYEAWMNILETSTSNMTELAKIHEERAIRESDFQTNPEEIVRRFCQDNDCGISTTFVAMLFKEIYHREWDGDPKRPHFATQRAMSRWLTWRPAKNSKRALSRSQIEFTRILHKIITTHDPARYGSISVQELTWRRK
jgi:hypothetical protein